MTLQDKCSLDVIPKAGAGLELPGSPLAASGRKRTQPAEGNWLDGESSGPRSGTPGQERGGASCMPAALRLPSAPYAPPGASCFSFLLFEYLGLLCRLTWLPTVTTFHGIQIQPMELRDWLLFPGSKVPRRCLARREALPGPPHRGPGGSMGEDFP